MIPRWNTSSHAIAVGEVESVGRLSLAKPVGASSGVLALYNAEHDSLSSLASDWQRSKKLGYAADLVSAASLTKRDAVTWPAVLDAAEFVVRNDTSGGLLSDLASRILTDERPNAGRAISGDPSFEDVQGDERDSSSALYSTVRHHRRAIERYPYDPFRWMDLARAHVSLGNHRAAERAGRTALALAPDHRFILRCAVRLFIHLGAERPSLREEAWDRLRRSPATKRDPWLTAAEIGTAMVLERTPRFVKTGRTLLASNAFSSFNTAELASALGSLEIESGSLKAGKRFFEKALITPTENAIAQASWTAQHKSIDLLKDRQFELAKSSEARAWDGFRDQSWSAAVDATLSWRSDEPFSRRPYYLGTFLAAAPLGDFELSVRIGEQGLAINSNDATLRNNLAFAYASLGKVNEATNVLSRVRLPDLADEEKMACVATWGLICFRLGKFDEGRKTYEIAMDIARALRQPESEALAATYLAREEVLAQQSDADNVYTRASKLLKKSPKPYLRAVFEQVTALRKRLGGNAPAQIVNHKASGSRVAF
jgi:tetratricopeptide (TPR) repeat protein